MDETAEWCNGFVLIPKENGKIRFCLDPAWLSKVLITPVHRGPTLNDILPRVTGMKYFTSIDVTTGYP